MAPSCLTAPLAPLAVLCPGDLLPLFIAVTQMTPDSGETTANILLSQQFYGSEIQKEPSGDGASLLWDV